MPRYNQFDPSRTRFMQGVSAGIAPYYRQASQQGAAGIASRGGLGSGAQDYMASQLTAEKLGTLGEAASQWEEMKFRAELEKELARLMQEPWWQGALKGAAKALPFLL